ncbi:MAG TPA: glycosyl hydrolase, partial [Caldilineaceae bacterium]|nr:glycosyl hydrolase [Caldilineaceae bacterium]
TWSEISDRPGFPKGLKGKIGVAASPAKAGRVWAIVEAKEEPGFYRSDDYGESWTLLTDLPDLRQRPWYYCHVIADPQDADTVYVLNLSMWKSTDGGKTFSEVGTPHGDNHDLWIDPRNNRRMIEGNDGGACVSFNGGETFSTIYNQLTAQFYHLDVDNQFPYRVYGTQQDNSSISVPSDTISGAIAWADCHVAGTGESGYIAVKPDDPNIVYVGAVGSSPGGLGALQRYDHRTGQIQLVNVWPEATGGVGVKAYKYRFPWTYPILFSPHDPGVLYTCANVAFRSTDEGHSWQPFSPDLTRNDETKMEASGGPITLDTSGAEHYGTISTFRESPHEAGVFWAGSDDGLVHLSRDGGQSWQNVTPPDLPEWSLVRTVEPSPHDPATLYLAATRYKLDDPAPYLYKTSDYGATWQKIVEGIPADDYTRVIRADPNHRGLLYAGTETGLYVSLDDGASWRRWQGNLPVAPIYDLAIKGSDLVAATHGRSFWILDDLTPLYQLMDAQQSAAADELRLFRPRAAYRILPDLFAAWTTSEGRGYSVGLGAPAIFTAKKTEHGQVERRFFDAGQGAPRGAILYYHLPAEVDAKTPIRLEILDGQGQVIRTIKPKPEGYDKLDEKEKSLDTGPWLPVKPGFNRFVWDLRYEGAVRVPGNKTATESLLGPLALPGEYQVRLTVGEQSVSAPLPIVNDPRVQTAQADLEAQHALLLRIRDKISDAHRGVLKLRDLREQVQGWRKRLVEDKAIVAAADAALGKLEKIEDALILPGEQKNVYGLVQRPRLNSALASLISVVASADAKPTASAVQLVDHYSGLVDEQLAQLQAVIEGEVAALNTLLRERATPAIIAGETVGAPA